MHKKIITTIVLALCFHAQAHEDLHKTSGLVTAGGKLITLLGDQVEVGQQAPDFKVVDERFSPVTLSDFKGKTVMISVVPSLDTGVCSLQTKRFNEEVANLPEDVVMLTISNDLPFAQKRFCQAESVDQLKVLSDSVWRDFGAKYGLLIKDMGLLSRAIIVIDKHNKITYKELVSNISTHPKYDEALMAVQEAVNGTEPSPSAAEEDEETSLTTGDSEAVAAPTSAD
ncbi:thiol peroxidase [Thalassotalea aquiviva]|uniref:thiol peroxidase n=1 Tax=Thalassotalea aquiviva TaxID=3242415 RepID=UPI00352AE431